MFVSDRYTCTRKGAVFFWHKKMMTECCQACDGKVYASGSVIQVEDIGGVCGGKIERKCVSYGEISWLANMFLGEE